MSTGLTVVVGVGVVDDVMTHTLTLLKILRLLY